MTLSSPNVELISECFIKPQNISDEAKEPIHFSPFDLSMISLEYIQKGLLFSKPQDNFSIATFLQKLKLTLSTTLTHFYPLAGRLVTRKQENPHSHIIYLDPNNGPGAKFTHAKVDLYISDILLPSDVPRVVQSFFDRERAINHDGHTLSLLAVQVTELVDGIFISCSINHVLCDGTSFWHFFNTWSELFKDCVSQLQALDLEFEEQNGSLQIPLQVPDRELGVELTNIVPHPPLHHRSWYNAIVNLPFTQDEQFLKRPVVQMFRERVFHFSSAALSSLKAKANSQSNIKGKISTLQAVTAHLWRCITRARTPPLDQQTRCLLAVNNRSRLNPPLSNDNVGNYVRPVVATVTVRELLERDNSIGWAAELLHGAVASQDERTVQQYVEGWVKSPRIPVYDGSFDPYSVLVGSSPRFNIYGTEFGLGKALAVRSGRTNKCCGKVTLYPGIEGGGSIDMEICLLPETMAVLENDHEFIAAMSI